MQALDLALESIRVADVAISARRIAAHSFAGIIAREAPLLYALGTRDVIASMRLAALADAVAGLFVTGLAARTVHVFAEVRLHLLADPLIRTDPVAFATILGRLAAFVFSVTARGHGKHQPKTDDHQRPAGQS